MCTYYEELTISQLFLADAVYQVGAMALHWQYLT